MKAQRSATRIFLAVWIIPFLFFSEAQAATGRARAPQTSLPVSSSFQVWDVSDRAYAVKVRELVGAARFTIDLSLKSMDAGDSLQDAVKVILDDLMSAAKRGVRVRLFLNTSGFEETERSIFLRDDKLVEMRSTGMLLHFVHPKHPIADQVLLFDSELVLEGGPVWTHQGLTEGWGAATLTRSRELASQKRARLELLPLWDLKSERDAHLDGEIPIPLFLIQDVKYFSSMVQSEDGDSLRVYLTLLEKFFKLHSTTFTISMADLKARLPSSDTQDPGSQVYLAYEALRRLGGTYDLAAIKNEDPNQVEINLKLPEKLDPVIRVPEPFFHENYAKSLSPRALVAYFILMYRFQMSGASPVWIGTEANVEQDFPITRDDFRLGVQELRRENLIEVYPFSLRQGSGYLGPDSIGYRYLLNEIPTLSERLETWSRLRDDFGEDEFRRARALADQLGEPEDPKVVVTYMQLLTEYAKSDIESLTQHVAQLPPTSTPDLLNYLRQLLKNETQPSQGLTV